MSIAQRVEFAIADERLVDDLWTVYRQAFKVLELGIENQLSYTERSFKDAMRDPEYVKFIILDDTGRALGYELATGNLQKAKEASYVNPAGLIAKFPAEAAAGKLWYITSLAVLPEAQDEDASALIVELIVKFAVENGITFAFDWAWDLQPDFPKYVLHQVRKAIAKYDLPVERASFTELGGQHYGAIILPPKKPST